MHQRLTPATAGLLILSPLLWAGNAVVGRLMVGQVPPITLNLLRWAIAFVILAPFSAWLLRRDSPLWAHWRRYSMLGLLGIGCYNALQYLALETSTPLNVTLVAASTPAFMLGIGAVWFGQRISRRQVIGAVLSITGVLIVLSRGDADLLLQVRLVPGDIFILLATAAWAVYSWLLTRPDDPADIRSDWVAFVMAQMFFGLGWSAAFAAGEWVLQPQRIVWSWAVIAALAYIALGPAILAYRAWGIGVQRVGPAIAGFFSNLTPLFAALMSTAVLGEVPRLYHGLAFVLIVGGILVSSARPRA